MHYGIKQITTRRPKCQRRLHKVSRPDAPEKYLSAIYFKAWDRRGTSRRVIVQSTLMLNGVEATRAKLQAALLAFRSKHTPVRSCRNAVSFNILARAREPDHPPAQVFAFQQHENNKEEHERGRANWTERRRNTFLNELMNGISAFDDFDRNWRDVRFGRWQAGGLLVR